MDDRVQEPEVSVVGMEVRWVDGDGRSVRREFPSRHLAERFAPRLVATLQQAREDAYVYIEQQPEHDVDHPAAWYIAQSRVIEVLEATFPEQRFEWEISAPTGQDPLPRVGSMSWSPAPTDAWPDP